MVVFPQKNMVGWAEESATGKVTHFFKFAYEWPGLVRSNSASAFKWFQNGRLGSSIIIVREFHLL